MVKAKSTGILYAMKIVKYKLYKLLDQQDVNLWNNFSWESEEGNKNSTKANTPSCNSALPFLWRQRESLLDFRICKWILWYFIIFKENGCLFNFLRRKVLFSEEEAFVYFF